MAVESSVVPLIHQPDFNHVQPRRARFKLWELQNCWHCMVVGTCLTLTDVRQLAAKVGVSISDKNDYDVHQLAVECAANGKHPLTQRLQKQLDHKHALSIKQFRGAKTPETLNDLWNAGWRAGNVAGSLWAIVTHPLTTRAIITTVFGQVHMMSHLSGASTCVDREKLGEQERQINALTQELQTLKRRHQKTSDMLSRQMQLADSNRFDQQRQQALSLQVQRLKHAPKVSSGPDQAAIDARIQQSLDRTNELQRALDHEKSKTHQQTQDIRRLEKLLQTKLSDPLIPCSSNQKPVSEDATAELKLCGQCVLYLGGKAQQRRHFQALVESCDGRFLHHDGGRETCPHRIAELVSQADVVLCPTNCISHSAMQKARSLCARQDKPMIFMKRSSLSAFARSLQENLG